MVTDHHSNERHLREEVNESVRKLKARDPSDLLTVSELFAIEEMGIEDIGHGSVVDDGNVKYTEESEEDLRPENDLEACLEYSTFIHGTGITTAIDMALETMHAQICQSP